VTRAAPWPSGVDLCAFRDCRGRLRSRASRGCPFGLTKLASSVSLRWGALAYQGRSTESADDYP
jgi:hypothetical protein